MEKRQKNAGHWKGFIIFTLFVGIIVGTFSVISDNLPNLADGVTVYELIISYLAVMINSLPVWFILVMLVGYIFASDIWKAVLLSIFPLVLNLDCEAGIVIEKNKKFIDIYKQLVLPCQRL